MFTGRNTSDDTSSPAETEVIAETIAAVAETVSFAVAETVAVAAETVSVVVADTVSVAVAETVSDIVAETVVVVNEIAIV